MADIQFVEVIDVGPGYNTVRASDGNIYTFKGDYNWRSNNPGNIEYGPFAKSMGAIGSGAAPSGRERGFAIFPTYEAGQQARIALQFESPSYRDLSIRQAIERYAPPFENDTGAYVRAVAKAAGVSPDTKMRDLNPQQRQAFLAAQERVEGFRPGTISGAQGRPVPQSVVAQFNGSRLPAAPIPSPVTQAPTPAMMSPQLASLRSGPMDLGTRLGVAPLPAAFSPNLNAPGYQPVSLDYGRAQRDIRVQGLGSLLEGERLAPNRVYNGATGVAAQPAVARAYGSATLPPPPAPTPYPAVQSASLSSRRAPLASTVTPLSLPPIPQPNAPRPATMSADIAARRAPLAASITPLNLPPIPQPLSAAGSAVSGAGASGAARGLAAIPNARQPVQQTMSASGAIRTNPLAGSVAMPAGVRPNVSIPMTARGTAAMATPGASARSVAVMPPGAPFPATMSPALAAQRQAPAAPRPAMPSPQMQAQRANPVTQNTQRAISSLPSTGGSGLFQSGGYVFAQNPDGSFTNMGRVGSAGTGGGGSDMFSSLGGISRAVTSAGNGLLGLVGLSNGSGGYSGPISSQAARGIAAGGDPYTQTSDWWAQATGG